MKTLTLLWESKREKRNSRVRTDYVVWEKEEAEENNKIKLIMFVESNTGNNEKKKETYRQLAGLQNTNIWVDWGKEEIEEKY